MAQRRDHAGYGAAGALRRTGLAGGRLAAVGLVVLACLAAGVGLVVQRSSAGFELVRGAEPVGVADAADAADVAGAAAVPADETEDGGAGERAPVVEAVPHYRVHVDGAVATPGVVELQGEDLRVADAVDACGGLTAEADTAGVNLAEPLVDGCKIHIPVVGEQAVAPAAEATVGQSLPSGASEAVGGQTLININTATAAELQQLRGIGEVTAQAIVDDRASNGPFATPEDLMRVSGIGEKKFEGVRGSICV